MNLSIDKISENISNLEINEESFIFDFLLSFGIPESTVSRLEGGDFNLSGVPGELLWKKKLFFKISKEQNLLTLIDDLKRNDKLLKHKPIFIIVTDFKSLLACDLKSGDTLDIKLDKLPKHFHFFLPLINMEKAKIETESIADIKAAEKLAQLYDIIVQQNEIKTDSEKHALNVFLTRLLFCFFAEDTRIFSEGLFTKSLASHTADDGSDLSDYLNELFSVLNDKKRKNIKGYLAEFPYVNGGLFKDNHTVPRFTSKSRKIIIECGSLNWALINPDIFGSMIQAVAHHGARSEMGMHYTSVANIMKVINPLFLNDLREEFEKAGDSDKKLKNLLNRIYNFRIFDPACGSGNFLIISYKRLCELEIMILQKLYKGQMGLDVGSRVRTSQFYGIEIDDFACETAKLSLWLAEHQMNLEFEEVIGVLKPTLPLAGGGNIICGNACKLDWEEVCPKEASKEIYILGNPPYSGSKNQSKSQKDDLKHVLNKFTSTKSLDYIACWFVKASEYVEGNQAFSFVSTNSLFQGTQVPVLWPIIDKLGVEIFFAVRNFLWSNNAKGKAGVTCSIAGLRKAGKGSKTIFEAKSQKQVKTINAYLIDGPKLYFKNRSNVLSKLPRLQIGNEAYDCGHLTFTDSEKLNFVQQYPSSAKFFRKVIGSIELIRGYHRWCLWIKKEEVEEALAIKGIYDRVELVRQYRESGGMNAKSCADRPYQFRWTNEAKHNQIILPVVSSQRREYIPMAFFPKEVIPINSAQVIFDPKPYIFSILNSRIHMQWVKLIGGKLKTDYRYNAGLCYNTFPFPTISEQQEHLLEVSSYKILEIRERHSEHPLSELYDPEKMPKDLRAAHLESDLVVESCYRQLPFRDDGERLECLFGLYQNMIDAEKKNLNKKKT